MKRRTFIKNSGIALGAMSASPLFSNFDYSGADDYPVMDLHVHLTRNFTIDHVMDIAKKRNIQIGIVEHPASWAIKDDKDLRKYIDALREYPVYIGLQPIDLGWSRAFSDDLLSEVDYILMDPQRVPMPNGERLKIWMFDTYIEDTEEFMDAYMDYTMKVINNEPIDIFGWPLFLPVCIARDYYSLWTKDCMEKIINAAKAKNIAIEINDMSHTPHKEFIHMAKDAGLKFTFGSDARNQNAGRLAYCKQVAGECKLVAEDFYVPQRKMA